MSGLADELTAEIPCPQCSAEITQTLRELQNEPKLTCPVCGTAFKLQTSADSDDVVVQLDHLDRTLRDLGKS